MDRIEALHQLRTQDPADPFPTYALALEYRKNSATEALRYFELLLQNFPDYLPTYYQAAQLYAHLNQSEAAQRTYEAGIGLAQRVGNAHALRELRAAYEQWRDEQDD